MMYTPVKLDQHSSTEGYLRSRKLCKPKHLTVVTSSTTSHTKEGRRGANSPKVQHHWFSFYLDAQFICLTPGNMFLHLYIIYCA